MDGGIVLLLCFYYGKMGLMSQLLGGSFRDFWRFAQLKTALWACLTQGQNLATPNIGAIGAYAILDSPTMKQIFCTLPFEQRASFASYVLDLGFEMNAKLRDVLYENPYACSFVIELASPDSFKELAQIDGYRVFDEAVENIILHELEQAPESFHAGLTQFIQFISIQNPDSAMYQSGMKFIQILKQTKAFQNVEVGAGDDFGEAELEMEEDENLIESMQAPENVDFSIKEFKRLLFETNEGSMLQMMMASDKTQALAKKIPQEALFIDWHDGLTRSYREQARAQENSPAEGEQDESL